MQELVVLVDENNKEVGTASKDTVHTTDTPLHRGFSVFLFNSKNELLLTRRALTKKTFAGVWTNTVCGHPAPGESVVNAAKRRLKDELGYPTVDIKEAAPYRYRFADADGIFENEICPVLVARSDATPMPNKNEIGEWRWIPWMEFLEKAKNHPENYSPWSVEEATLLSKIGSLFL